MTDRCRSRKSPSLLPQNLRHSLHSKGPRWDQWKGLCLNLPSSLASSSALSSLPCAPRRRSAPKSSCPALLWVTPASSALISHSCLQRLFLMGKQQKADMLWRADHLYALLIFSPISQVVFFTLFIVGSTEAFLVWLVYFCFCCLCFGCDIHEILAKTEVKKLCSCVFFLGVLPIVNNHVLYMFRIC